MSICKVLEMKQIADIKRLRRITKKGKKLYTQKRLGLMYHVDQKTICNYLKEGKG